MELPEIFVECNEYSLQRVVKPREVDINSIIKLSKTKIVMITGVRRSGKSCLLNLIHQKLKKNNKKVLYINFDDNRLKRENILDTILSWFGDKGYLLLDEITNIPKWQDWLYRTHEMTNLQLIITSSRSHLIAPKKMLRGRTINIELYPLSFKEYLRFNDKDFTTLSKTTAGRGILKKIINKYLIYGGFPEVALTKNKSDKVKILNSYFNDIIGLDIADSSGVKISIVELFSKYVLASTYFSASKCYNFIKNLGYKISKETLLSLEYYSQKGCLFFFNQIFSYSIKDLSQYPRKIYIIDNGFITCVSGKIDKGRLLENAVFIELMRNGKKVYYWKNKEGNEVDFVIQKGKGIEAIIQVCCDISDEKTLLRETKSIINCAKEFRMKKGIIITNDYEGKKTVEGINIKFIPFLKWLLYSTF
ncbi:ATP-binding protein [Candidatus Micrarchaeota archaeon]|nr:ATP-binding protein [Candidatus Micrarchaeota archaeon]